MSKAEDLAKELFPLLETDKIGNNPYITYNSKQLAKQEGFIRGYHQAEKDLELSWEDIADILDVTDVIANDDSMEERLKTMSEEEYCQEVLKRFKDYKEREEI